MYDSVLVRYGEIFLKSTFVRRRLENMLAENIRRKLSEKVVVLRGRLVVETKDFLGKKTLLETTPGVVSFSPAVSTSPALEKLSETVLDFSSKILSKEKTFAVRAKAVDQEYSSKDLENVLGEKIRLSSKAGVDLSNPDETVYVESRGRRAWVYSEVFPGIGGLPLGSQGKAVALVDSDKAVLACFLILKRGCETSALADSFGRTRVLEKYGLGGTFLLEGNKDKKKQLLEAAFSKKADAVVLGFGFEEFCSDPFFSEKIPVFYPVVGFTEKEAEEKFRAL